MGPFPASGTGLGYASSCADRKQELPICSQYTHINIKNALHIDKRSTAEPYKMHFWVTEILAEGTWALTWP